MKADHKTHTRMHIRHLFQEHSSQELQQYSHSIVNQLLILFKTKNLKHIGFFAPMKDEPNIWPIFEQNTQNVFFFPRVIGNDLEFVRIETREQLHKGEFGVLEPIQSLTSVEQDLLQGVLVPGVAFDDKGHRLGRGAGYYDRFLLGLPQNVLKIGVCFPFQVLYEVPVDEHDQKVDIVVS